MRDGEGLEDVGEERARDRYVCKGRGGNDAGVCVADFKRCVVVGGRDCAEETAPFSRCVCAELLAGSLGPSEPKSGTGGNVSEVFWGEIVTPSFSVVRPRCC